MVATRKNVTSTENTIAKPALFRQRSRPLLIRRLWSAPTAYCRASSHFSVTKTISGLSWASSFFLSSSCLERRLLDPLVRASATEVSALLAEDFVEFGSSGHVYSRASMILALSFEPQGGPFPEVNAYDMVMRFLAPGVALLTYRTERRSLGRDFKQSRRSSIWKFLEGQWQMTFHQGAPISVGPEE